VNGLGRASGKAICRVCETELTLRKKRSVRTSIKLQNPCNLLAHNEWAHLRQAGWYRRRFLLLSLQIFAETGVFCMPVPNIKRALQAVHQ